MTRETDQPECRRYRRIHAPVFVEVLGYLRQKMLIRSKRAKVTDISLDGVRVYSDGMHKPGEHLSLELFFPDNSSLAVTARNSLDAEPPRRGPGPLRHRTSFFQCKSRGSRASQRRP